LFLYSIKIRKNPILAPPKSHKIACFRRFFKTQNPKPNLKPKISPFQGDFFFKKAPAGNPWNASKFLVRITGHSSMLRDHPHAKNPESPQKNVLMPLESILRPI
jgi:hypothetical protein